MTKLSARTIYRVVDFLSTFTKHEGRRAVRLSWVSVPNREFDSSGYRQLIRTFGDDAAKVYGAWTALVCIASTCPFPGILCNKRGIPLTAADLDFVSRFGEEVFDQLFEFCLREDVNWLEIVCESELSEMFQNAETSPADTDPTGTRHPPDTRTALQNNNKTEQIDRSTNAQARDGLMVDKLGFLEGQENDAKEKANKIHRAENRISLDLAWQIACCDVMFSPGMYSDLMAKLRGQSVRKPGAYARKILHNFAEQHGKVLGEFIAALPDPPAKQTGKV